jgi:hypothetical protein
MMEYMNCASLAKDLLAVVVLVRCIWLDKETSMKGLQVLLLAKILQSIMIPSPPVLFELKNPKLNKDDDNEEDVLSDAGEYLDPINLPNDDNHNKEDMLGDAVECLDPINLPLVPFYLNNPKLLNDNNEEEMHTSMAADTSIHVTVELCVSVKSDLKEQSLLIKKYAQIVIDKS